MEYAPPCAATAEDPTQLARCWWRGGPAGGAFSIRLRDPADPANSPHWTSAYSNTTYATAWDVVLRPPLTDVLDGPLRGADVTLELDALVPHAENRLGQKDCFWEGAAAVRVTSPAAAAGPAGFAFIEQMGYEP